MDFVPYAFYLGVLLLSYYSARVTLPAFLAMIERSGMMRGNYRGEMIPAAGGIIFIIIPTVWLMVGSAFGFYSSWQALSMVTLLMAFGLAGLLDDTLGTREKTGFKGHFAAMFQGELTTGGLKAIIGGLAALSFGVFVGRFTQQLYLGSVLLNSLMVALSANALNIFDLRPGRAGKTFILATILILLTARLPGQIALLFPVIGVLLAYLPFDLDARVMMGDTGSNPLGAALGVFAALSLGTSGKLAYLAALTFLHIMAEFVSFSEVIDRSPLLRAVDRWGRRE